MQQIPRIIKKVCRQKIAKAIKLHAKKEIITKELEIAQVEFLFFFLFFGGTLNLPSEYSRIL